MLGRIDFAQPVLRARFDKGRPASLADAKAKGIPVIAYGQLINDIIGFLIVAAGGVSAGEAGQPHQGAKRRPAAAPTTRECPFCVSTISKLATRCPNCTSELVVVVS